jgi:hypothetical protein
MRRTLETPQTFDLEEEERLTGLMYVFPSENTKKTSVLEESAPPIPLLGALALPLTLFGSVIKLLWPFLGSAGVFRSAGTPLNPTGECCSTLMSLLRERYLFWAVVELLR